MAARVVFTAGFSRRYTGGVREFMVEAENLRGVIKAMDQLYPGLGHHLERKPPSRSTVRSARPLFSADPRGVRGVFIPKLEGGSPGEKRGRRRTTAIAGCKLPPRP